MTDTPLAVPIIVEGRPALLIPTCPIAAALAARLARTKEKPE